jgi:hypothetical protein
MIQLQHAWGSLAIKPEEMASISITHFIAFPKDSQHIGEDYTC